MPRNGSGVYSAPVSSFNPAVNGQEASSTDWNTLLADVSAAVTQSVASDGQTAITANLPMSGYKHIGVAAGSSATDYARFDQLQSSSVLWVGTTSGTNTVTATPSPTISAYTAGMVYRGKLGGTCTGAVTLNLGPSAVAVQKNQSALVAGDFTSGDSFSVLYDGAVFQLLSPARTPVLTNGAIGTNAIAGGAVQNSKLTNMATATFKGRTSTGSGSPEDLTATQATALLNAFTGDSGAGGVKGLVPAPASGDAAANKYLKADGAWTSIQSAITLGTMVASTSGTAINFTSLPAGLKRITVNFSGVSTNGTDHWIVQIGDSGGIENTGYLGGSTVMTNGASLATVNYTDGIGIRSDTASNIIHGAMTFTLMDAATNLWAATGAFSQSNTTASYVSAGSKALSATLDRIRITTTGGTNTFDTGNINIMYE